MTSFRKRDFSRLHAEKPKVDFMPLGRLLFLICGAFLVFQTGGGLSVPKLIYFAGVAISVLAAVVNLRRCPDQDWLQRTKPSLLGAGLLASWILVPTCIQAIAINGVPMDMWARDAVTYLLISAAVVIGIDAARSWSIRWARFATVIVGSVSAVGFTVAWVQRRGFGEVSGEPTQVILASLVALTLPLALCLVLGLAQSGVGLHWLLVAASLFVAVVVTGTRAGFVLAIAVLGICGRAKKLQVPTGKLALGTALCAASVALALPLAGAWVSSERFVQDRIDSMFRTMQLGFGQDYSGQIRERAHGYALDIFNENPIMGQGLGLYFPNPNPNSVPANFTIDTPAVYLAKFGLLGTAVFVVALTLIIAPLVLKRNGPHLLEITAIRGALVVWIALLPFGPTTEDKGFAIDLALAFVLVGAALRHARAPERKNGMGSAPVKSPGGRGMVPLGRGRTS